MAGPQDLQKALDAANVSPDIKADAWDAYFGASSPDDFRQRFDKIKLPDDAKAKLWDLKFSGGIDAKPPAERRLGADQAKTIEAGSGPVADIFHRYAIHQGLPLFGGIAGEVIGGRFGMPIRGGAIGAGIGRRAVQYIDALTGRKPLPKTGEALEQVGATALEQAAYTGAGQVVKGLARGPLRSAAEQPSIPATSQTAQVANPIFQAKSAAARRQAGVTTAGDLLETSNKYRLNLTTPEILAGTKAGSALGALQHGASRSIAGKTIAGTYRREGIERATKFITDALDKFASKTSAQGVGQSVKAGLRAGKEGFERTTRAELAKTIENGPTVPMDPLKGEAQRMFDEEIAPLLRDFPALAGKAGGQMQTNLSPQQFAKLAPAQQQQLRQAMQQAFQDALAKHPNSPTAKIINEILSAGDNVSFDSAVRYSERLRDAGKLPDELLGKGRAKGAATHLANVFREHLATLNPDWAVASKAYGADARLFQKKFIRDIAQNDPEVLLNSLSTKTGKTTPSRIDALRTILLEKAGAGGDVKGAAAGKQAWNQLRRAWFAQNIVGDDVGKMAARIDKVDPDTLKAFFPDQQGQAFLDNARELAGALKARLHEPNSRLYEILEFSKIGAALGAGAFGLAQGGVGRGIEYAAATTATLEGVPGLVTWALYNPKMTNYLIKGLTDRDPSIAASSLFRLVGEYAKDTRVPGERGSTLPPVPGPVH